MVNVEQLQNQVVKLVEGSDMLVISTRQEYEALCRQEDVAVAIKKQVEEYFGPDIKKAHELHKSLTGKRKALVDPLDKFISVCKNVCGGFLASEQRKEQERLDAIRREAERIRAEQEAKIAAEAAAIRAKQEAERKAQEEAFRNSPEELAKAKARLEAERLAAEAELQRKRESMIDTSLVPQEAPKTEAGEGRAIVQTWTYEIVNEDLIPKKYWVLDHSKIRTDVSNFKDKAQIPGIKVVQQSSVRRTGK